MEDNKEYIYARDGKINIIGRFHNSHAEGQQSFATGSCSYAEECATARPDSYENQMTALAQSLNKVAAQTGASVKELADAIQNITNVGMQDVAQSLQNLEKSLSNTSTNFSSKTIPSIEKNQSSNLRLELKTLNPMEEYGVINVSSDAKFDF